MARRTLTDQNSGPCFGTWTSPTPSSRRIVAIASRAAGSPCTTKARRTGPPSRRTHDLQLVAVGVGRVAGDRLDLGLPLVLLSQNPHALLAALNPAAQGVLRLEADEEHQVAVVSDAVGQVMQDSCPTRPCPTRR